MKNQRINTDGQFWSDKLMDLANLEIVVTVFSQFSESKINLYVISIGSIIYISITVIAIKFRDKKLWK